MGKALASGLIGLGLAIGGWAMPVAFPNTPIWVGEYMLWVALACFTLAGLLALLNSSSSQSETDSATQKSSGDWSPNLKGWFRDVHIHSPPQSPLPPPPTPPAERIERYRTYVDGLGRALGASDAQYKSDPKPDVAMPYFLGRVYKKCGKPPDDGRLKSSYYKRVDREIQDAVVLNKLSTWGYYGDTAIRPIAYRVLQNAVLDHRNKMLKIPSDSALPMVMKDLRFNKEQVDAIWPE